MMTTFFYYFFHHYLLYIIMIIILLLRKANKRSLLAPAVAEEPCRLLVSATEVAVADYERIGQRSRE